ncbi:hypothetical protein AGMMS49975_10490 [Clostridia bacterium]|nr:hypothetical protein AGMMS49975_10490 [Clostridia bacterium]
MKIRLGSLFDGAGGFPLAGLCADITPVWGSEIEPFPALVTHRRLPETLQLGDLTKIDGAKIPPVQIITFGSPCQDLSIAKGKRDGLNGKRSGLFSEAVRIIKEMREATSEKEPRFAVWENVVGAFSSRKGEDFRLVLEELVKIRDFGVSIPRPKEKWREAGEIVGDDYSVAWRVLAAEMWGVPQRRHRIYLVADFGGESASEILFERESVLGYFTPSDSARERIAATAPYGVAAAGENQGFGGSGFERGGRGRNRGNFRVASGFNGHKSVTGTIQYAENRAPTLEANMPSNVLVSEVYGLVSKGSNSWKSDNPKSGCYKADTARTLDQNGGTPLSNQGGMLVTEISSDAYNPWDFQSKRVRRLDGFAANINSGGGGGGAQTGLYLVPAVPCAGFVGRQGAGAGSVGYQENVAPTLRSDIVSDVVYQELIYPEKEARTLTAEADGGNCVDRGPNFIVSKVYDARGNGCGNVANTITGDHNGHTNDYMAVCVQGNTIERSDTAGAEGKGALIEQSYTLSTADKHAVAYCLDRASYNQGQNALFSMGIAEEQSPTLVAKGPHAVAQNAEDCAAFTVGNGQTDALERLNPIAGTLDCMHETQILINASENPSAKGFADTVKDVVSYIVRRLTPLECCRLQGYPDWWCEGLAETYLTESDDPKKISYEKWWEVAVWQLSFAEAGRPKSWGYVKNWLRQPSSDAVMYKMWGNSLAIPCAFTVLNGIAGLLRDEERFERGE